MDATRSRRTRDDARQRWYARWRSLRFARHLGFTSPDDPNPKASSRHPAGMQPSRVGVPWGPSVAGTVLSSA
jgi:hypothetical protein